MTRIEACPECGLHPYDFTVGEYKRELDRVEADRDRALDLLRRLNEWDAWTLADQWPLGDAPYWKAEIERTLLCPTGGDDE